MKYKTMMLSVLFSIFFFSFALLAQDESPAKDDNTKKEMKKDQWEQAMKEATARRDALKHEVDSLDQAIATLRTRDSDLAAQIQKGEAELTAMLDQMKSQRNELERQLNEIDGKLNNLAQVGKEMLLDHEGDLDGVASSLAAAKANKLAQLQEYKDRIDKQEQRLNDMRSLVAELKSEQHEIVVGTWEKNRACLWNIAKKSNVYGDPTLWVKIWQSNTAKISNPDIIRPGQRLHVPRKAALTRVERNALREYAATHSEESGQFAAHSEQK